MIADSVRALVGHTPLVRLQKFAPDAQILAKLEMCNPGGSVKDRAAFFMVEDALACGRLKPGGLIVEPTSGNTGIGLCVAAAAYGCRVILAMPETMSEERRRLIKSYGGELVLTDGKAGMRGAIAKAEELCAAYEGAYMPGQFSNPANARAHVETTGPEIYTQTEGGVDVLVSAVGTGGTLTGTARYLKSQNPAIQIVAVEPAESPVLSGGTPGPHGIQGIGAGFVPALLEVSLIDKIVTVTTAEAVAARSRLATQEGLSVGISSGAALCAAIKLTAEAAFKDKRIVVICPDGGERYLSIL